MNNHENILITLRKHLLNVSGVTQSVVAYQNITFVPLTDGSWWLRENYLPIDEMLASDGFMQATGIYKVDVVVPKGRGTEDLFSVAKLICDAFKPAQSIQDSGLDQNICIYKCSQGIMMNEEAGEYDKARGVDPVWCFLPIEIYWRSYAVV